MTIKQALLKVRDTRTYGSFFKAIQILNIKAEYDLTDYDEKVIASAEMEVMLIIRDFTRPILQSRMMRHRLVQDKGIYAGKAADKVKKFFDVLKKQIREVLPEYSPFFERRWNQRIMEEVYWFSVKQTP
jgi:hypothetical protein